MKRLDISGLKSGYFMRFQIGIIIALAATIAAFNFTTYPAEAHDVGLVFIDEWIDEDIPIKIVYVAPKPKKAKVIKKPVIVEPEFQEIDVEEIVTFTDEMPRFNACEDMDGGNKEKEKCANQALIAYVLGNIKYPRMALENGITGTVVIQFIVEKDGSISGAKIARDIGGGCGAEALRVVKTLPAWIPGKQRSRPVRVKFSLPVKFNAI